MSTARSPFHFLDVAVEVMAGDIPTFVLPGVLFAITAVYVGDRDPGLDALLSAGGQTLLFAVLATLCVDLSNQIVGVDEDRINKPWRPLPAGRISPREAWAMAVASWCALVVVSALQEMLLPALGLFAANAYYNHLGGDRHWLPKNGCNAAAYAWLFLAAIESASPTGAAVPAALLYWLAASAGSVFLTIGIQDLRDDAGDQARGRTTFHMWAGDQAARIFWTIALVGATVSAILVWQVHTVWAVALAWTTGHLVGRLAVIYEGGRQHQGTLLALCLWLCGFILTPVFGAYH